MPLREALVRVLDEYETATTTSFKGSPVAEFLRRGFPETLRAVVDGFGIADVGDYKFEGSAGQGQWVRCPWIAIFDPVVTVSAQRGYYPVYLFREDFTGVYLSLNQGVTDVREQYKSRVKEALRTRAADYRARLGKVATALILTEMGYPLDSGNHHM